MADKYTSRLRCLAKIETLGGLARPDTNGATYRLTLNLIEDSNGNPIDGRLETHFDDFHDRLEEALVEDAKIWVSFTPVETDRYNPTGGNHARSAGKRLRVLEAKDIEISWDDPGPRRKECPQCHGTGQIDISVGPRRIVDCDNCEGLGTVRVDT